MDKLVILSKILEYGRITRKEALVKISDCLDLEFYYEQDTGLCTLSTEAFVLDISETDCNLIFVDEVLNTKFEYIQNYLSNFLHKKHIFLYILKYIIACTKKNSNYKGQGSLEKHKCLCSCIFTDNYCRTYNFENLPKNFNIFTHTMIEIPILYYFYKPGDVLPKYELESTNINISSIVSTDNFDRYFLNIVYCKNEIVYEIENVKVIGNSVYINERRSQIASLAFLRGCTLSKCLEFAKLIN